MSASSKTLENRAILFQECYNYDSVQGKIQFENEESVSNVKCLHNENYLFQMEHSQFQGEQQYIQ